MMGRLALGNWLGEGVYGIVRMHDVAAWCCLLPTDAVPLVAACCSLLLHHATPGGATAQPLGRATGGRGLKVASWNAGMDTTDSFHRLKKKGPSMQNMVESVIG